MEKEQFKYLVDQNKKLIAIALPVLATTSIICGLVKKIKKHK